MKGVFYMSFSKKVIFRISLILIVYFLTSASVVSAQETEEQETFNLNTEGRGRIGAMFLAGFGLDDHVVGKTTEDSDVKISGGGGVGGALILGYSISSEFDLSAGFAFQQSNLRPKVENAEGKFMRTSLIATVKYRLPIATKGLLRFGAGIGYYMPDDLDLDMSNVSEGAHNIYSYKSSVGFHISAEYEGFFSQDFSWTAGLKFVSVTYDLESAQSNGISVPIDALPQETLDEIGELNGNSIDLTLSLNYYL
jgi:hypothetical protein